MIAPSGKILGDRLPQERLAPWLLAFALVLVGWALASGKLLVALAIVLAAVGGMVIFSRPDRATFLVIFLLYSNILVVGIHFHGVPRILGNAMLLLLLIPIFRDVVIRRGKVVLTPTFRFLLIYLGIQLLSTIFSRDVGSSLTNVMEFVIEGIAVYILVTNSVRTLETLRLASWALLIAGFSISIVPFHQQMTHNFKSDYGGFGQTNERPFHMGLEGKQAIEGQFRLSGTIGEQNRFAQNLLMLLPIGFFLILHAPTRSRQLLGVLLTSFSAVGCALSFSRGAALAFGIMVAIMTFMRIIKPRQLLVLILGIILIFAAMPHYLTRVVTVQKFTALLSGTETAAEEPDGSIRGRATEMIAAALVYVDHPIIGVGPGMFKFYSQEYGNPLGIRKLEEARRAHSLLLEIAAELGTAGLFCFLAITGVTMHRLFRARRQWLDTRPDLAGLATGYLLALVSYFSTGLFLHMSFMRFFYLILGLAAATAYILDSQGTVERTGSRPISMQSRVEARQ